MSDEPASEERDRGILSKADRAYLNGQKDLSEQGERDTRYRIRNRVKNGILDSIILDRLDQRDRELIFKDIKISGATGFLSFFLDGFADISASLDDAVSTYEDILEAAIFSVVSERDDSHIVDEVTVDISIDKREANIENILTNYYNGEESLDELRFLISKDDFGGDEALLSARMMKTFYYSAEEPEDMENMIMSNKDYDSVEEYFEKTDKKIAQEGTDRGYK